MSAKSLEAHRGAFCLVYSQALPRRSPGSKTFYTSLLLYHISVTTLWRQCRISSWFVFLTAINVWGKVRATASSVIVATTGAHVCVKSQVFLGLGRNGQTHFGGCKQIRYYIRTRICGSWPGGARWLSIAGGPSFFLLEEATSLLVSGCIGLLTQGVKWSGP